MSQNVFSRKASTLAQMLKAAGIKTAEQEIEHTTPTAQNNLGEEMQQVVNEQPGAQASNPADVSAPAKEVRQEAGVQDLNKPAEQALADTGTSVNNMTEDGKPAGTPAEEVKTASDYKAKLAQLIAQHKQAALEKQAAAAPEAPAAPQVISANEVLQKLASVKTEAEYKEACDLFEKMASSNPVFETARNAAMLRKQAEDIDELAAAKGITPEEAAAQLDAVVQSDPEAAAELEDEANGEALADLAQGEDAAAAMLGDLDNMAQGASQVLGVEVTPDDIIDAADQVAAAAEEMGVEPEELLSAAIQELTGTAPDMEGVTEEDMAQAQQLLDEAAAQGISPDEVLQYAAQELAGGEAPAEAPAETPAAEPAAEPTEPEKTEEGEEPEQAVKTASLQKLASTRRGQIALGM